MPWSHPMKCQTSVRFQILIDGTTWNMANSSKSLKFSHCVLLDSLTSTPLSTLYTPRMLCVHFIFWFSMHLFIYKSKFFLLSFKKNFTRLWTLENRIWNINTHVVKENEWLNEWVSKWMLLNATLLYSSRVFEYGQTELSYF